MSKRKKIKFFTLSLNLVSGGGSHLTLDLMLRYLQDQGYEVSLITLNSKNNRLPSSRPYLIDEKNITGNFLNNIEETCRLITKEAESCDLIFIYGTALLWGAGKYKKAGGSKPIIAYLNNYLPTMDIPGIPKIKLTTIKNLKYWLFILKMKIWNNLIGLKFINAFDLIMVDSPLVKKIYTNYGITSEKICVVPEFIDISIITNSIDLTLNHNPKDGLNILYTGRLIFEKGLDILIKALVPITRENKIQTLIIGEGPDRQYLEKLISQFGLEDYIKIIPWQSQAELTNFYRQADIFVHPCRWPEPFGRTIVEAMAFGLPIITSQESGSAWVMGQAGLSFQNNNVEDLRQKILQLTKNQHLREQLHTKALEEAKKFDYHIIGKLFQEKITSLN